MPRHRSLSTLLFLLLLALAAMATAAPPAAVAPTAAIAPIAPTAPAVASPSTPAWDPAILAGLETPVPAKSDNPLSQVVNPSFCPPPCIACPKPRHCGSCHIVDGCNQCTCLQ
ncbi:MAG TPA: hypothetical protein VOA87_18805 [Thermoanaerobaculia bacterium]|nr:hypothetical protein [Thermoanaerobaculia bacterium]